MYRKPDVFLLASVNILVASSTVLSKHKVLENPGANTSFSAPCDGVVFATHIYSEGEKGILLADDRAGGNAGQPDYLITRSLLRRVNLTYQMPSHPNALIIYSICTE